MDAISPVQLISYCLQALRASRQSWPDSRSLLSVMEGCGLITSDKVRFEHLSRFLKEKNKMPKRVTFTAHPYIYRKGNVAISIVSCRVAYERGSEDKDWYGLTGVKGPTVMPRQLFEPSSLPSPISLGLWSKFESVLAELIDEERDEYVDPALIFKGLWGCSNPDEWMKKEGWMRCQGIYLATTEILATIHLETLCEKLLQEDGGNIGGAFAHLCDPRMAQGMKNFEYVSQIIPSELLPTRTQKESQALVSGTKSGMVAIQGPPGTGKTTLISNIVADAFFQAMVEDRPAPLVVIASTNNEAVDNALDSLRIMGKTSVIEPFGSTLGLRLVAQGTNFKSKHPHQSANPNSWPSTLLETLYSLGAVREKTIAQMRDIFPDAPHDIIGITKLLKGMILGGGCAQYNLWWLLVAYWQLRGLVELERCRDLLTSQIDGGINLVAWKKVVAPLYLATGLTVHMLPRWCAFSRGIDILIIDEAGQTPAHIAAPTLALAEKAVIIGDPMQLEPVVEIAKPVAAKIWVRNGLPKSRWKGFSTNDGSIMVAAQETARSCDSSGFLAECFRCPPKIVQIANQICYGGRIVAMRHDDGKNLVYVPVNGTCEKKAGSRINTVEAKAVVDFINRYKDKLLAKYGDLASAITILTPYREQAALIKEILGSDEIKVGTVHVMQGQQRKIVLFSVVSETWKAAGMLNKKPNLVNVALTRTQDKFFWFSKFAPPSPIMPDRTLTLINN